MRALHTSQFGLSAATLLAAGLAFLAPGLACAKKPADAASAAAAPAAVPTKRFEIAGYDATPYRIALVVAPGIQSLAEAAQHSLTLAQEDSPASRVILQESAMGPQIGAGIVATQNNLNPSLVTMMVGLGVPLCLVTVPLWSVALTRFGF